MDLYPHYPEWLAQLYKSFISPPESSDTGLHHMPSFELWWNFRQQRSEGVLQQLYTTHVWLWECSCVVWRERNGYNGRLYEYLSVFKKVVTAFHSWGYPHCTFASVEVWKIWKIWGWKQLVDFTLSCISLSEARICIKAIPRLCCNAMVCLLCIIGPPLIYTPVVPWISVHKSIISHWSPICSIA
jgi:hypothetical protein